MKKKYLNIQFQRHMLITVAIIALMAVTSVLAITYWRRNILPSDTELFIDVTSTFADGKSDTKTYRLDLASADGSKKYNRENDLEFAYAVEGTATEEPKLEVDAESEVFDIIVMNPSKVQTGTSFTVSKIQNGFAKLSRQEQKTYTELGYLQYILPVLYSLIGVIISCFIFYRRHIKKPIAVLAEATEKISGNNLDFEISSDCKNELGRLCDSFEQMREALAKNNKEMLGMIEERRRLQSSVAHDLRNPIAIMKGYLEMMEGSLDDEDFSSENFRDEIRTLSLTTDRMEEYVKSVSMINHLGDMEPEPHDEDIAVCIENWEKDMKSLAENSGIDIVLAKDDIGNEKWKLDVNAISRVLENIIKNGCRYAKTRIEIRVSLHDNNELQFDITDDGPGYPDKLLKNPDLFFYTTDQKNGHMGMGMTICRIICKKHQGSIEISNGENKGARTKIKFKNLI